MRAEIHGDELVVTLDADELRTRATVQSLAARLPRSAHDIAAEVVRQLEVPKGASEPATICSVTVKLVRTRVIGAETLMLDSPREVYG